MKCIFIILVNFIILNCAERAFAHSYKMCKVTIGQPTQCQMPYTGKAIVKKDNGEISQCTISIGMLMFCNGPYSGKAKIEYDGSIQLCNISIGHIAFCYGPYNGYAVLNKSQL